MQTKTNSNGLKPRDLVQPLLLQKVIDEFPGSIPSHIEHNKLESCFSMTDKNAPLSLVIPGGMQKIWNITCCMMLDIKFEPWSDCTDVGKPTNVNCLREPCRFTHNGN